jgi:hypothetical protein
VEIRLCRHCSLPGTEQPVSFFEAVAFGERKRLPKIFLRQWASR